MKNVFKVDKMVKRKIRKGFSYRIRMKKYMENFIREIRGEMLLLVFCVFNYFRLRRCCCVFFMGF